MSDELYRTYSPQLEVRSSGDGRTIYGIAVPYNAPMRINDSLVEEVEPGAFNHQFRAANRIKFSYEHLQLGGTLIGALTLMRDDAAGLYIETRAAKTPKGDEALELVREGALRDLSIGFRERENLRKAGGIVSRVKADLFEVALTLEGAYGDLASAAGVRSAEQYRGAGSLLTGEEASLRARAEEFLVGGLPDAPNLDIQIAAIRLGLRGW